MLTGNQGVEYYRFLFYTWGGKVSTGFRVNRVRNSQTIPVI